MWKTSTIVNCQLNQFFVLSFGILYGLRIVLDVVYNHLQGSGPSDEHSVLDKVMNYHEFFFG